MRQLGTLLRLGSPDFAGAGDGLLTGLFLVRGFIFVSAGAIAGVLLGASANRSAWLATGVATTIIAVVCYGYLMRQLAERRRSEN